jgi:GNAT superfamily N-acetyltransferase
LRHGKTSDLDAVNTLIQAAIMTWDLPERVKRLSMPSYCYSAHDLEHLSLVIAASPADAMLGIAAWERADANDAPGDQSGLLLHGIYVDPERHHEGVGSRLLQAAIEAARKGGYDGLLAKANKDAQGFFTARGLQPLPAERPGRDYPYRYWIALESAPAKHPAIP